MGSDTTVLTLVASTAGGLSEEAAASIAGAVSAGGAGAVTWLREGLACDIFPANLARAGSPDALKEWAALDLSVCVQPASERTRRLLCADMEGTLIGQETLDELAELTGRGAEIAAITRRAMAGELDFGQSLKARLQKLAGVTRADLHEVLTDCVTLNPGAAQMIATLHAHGIPTVLVSGGLRVFAEPIGQHLGVAEIHANRAVMDGEILSGEVEEPVFGRDGKEVVLRRSAADRKLPVGSTMAIGDGANDLDMIGAAGLGIAYKAKPALEAAVLKRIAEDGRGAVIRGDLTALLYFTGIPYESWAPAPPEAPIRPGGD